MKTFNGKLGRFLLVSALLTGAAVAGDCDPAKCETEQNGTDYYALCCVPKDGDLGQTADASCHFKATVGAKSDDAAGPITLPEIVVPAKTSVQGR